MCYFISPFHFNVPFELADYFPDRKKYFIEIGFGRGDFALYLAQNQQDVGYLGVEISSRSVLKLIRKLLKTKIDNIKAIKIDAFMLFSIIEPAFSIDNIIFNFPDPWPGHPERRVSSKEHLLLMHRILKRDGSLYIATDADILKEDIEQNTKGLFYLEKSKMPYFTFQTKYEKRWILEKRDIIYYRLTPLLYAGKYPILAYKGDGNMAHVIFKLKDKMKDLDLPLPVRLRPLNDMIIIIQRPYKRVEEYLFPVLVKERGFVQKTFFRLYVRGDEARLILDDTGYLVVTEGIRKAMAYLRDMLLKMGHIEVIRDTT